jgi:hypothetical protein
LKAEAASSSTSGWIASYKYCRPYVHCSRNKWQICKFVRHARRKIMSVPPVMPVPGADPVPGIGEPPPVPINEPEPDRLPDEQPVPNPDETPEPPQHVAP